MRSSRDQNEPEKIFKRLNFRSVAWGLSAVCVGLLVVGAIGIGSADGQLMSLPLLLGTAIVAAKFYQMSEGLYQGQFVGHNQELLEAKIKTWRGENKGGFCFEWLPYATFHERQDDMRSAGFLMGFDPNSLYRVSANMASEVFGYDLRDYRADDGKPMLYPLCYRSIYQQVLQGLPAGSVAQVVIRSSDYKSDFVASHRPALLEKGVKDVDVYLLVGLNNSAASPLAKSKLASVLQGFRRLELAEIAAHNELVALPRTPRSGLDLPFFAGTAHTDGTYVHTDAAGRVTAAAALGRLPKDADDYFVDYLEPLRGLTGTIVIRFIKSDVLSAGNVVKVMRQNTKEKEGAASVGEIAASRADESAHADGDRLEAHMDIFALVHGDRQKVDEALAQLHNPRLTKPVADPDRARIVPIMGHVKDAHAAVMAGSYHYLRARLQKVIRYTEASLYIPEPLTPNRKASESTLAFRNEDQSVEFIDLSFSDKSFFNAVVGPSGQGKSAFVSGVIRAHELRESLHGVKTATIVIDVGSSQRWRTESLGPNDTIFDLAKDDKNNWKPLPMHPLEALMFEGGASDSDINQARDYVCQLLALDPNDVAVAASVGVVKEAVRVVVGTGFPYTMTKLHTALGKVSALEAEKFSGGERERFVASWTNYLAYIKRFTKDGEFGRVFEPAKVTRTNLKGVTLFYANVEAQEKDPRDLNAAFLTLCHSLAFAIANRYGPYSKVESADNKRSILWIIDEYNWQKSFINESKTTDMADQCRKYGIITMVLVQDFSYLAIGRGPDRDLSLFKSLAKIFFYDDGGEANREILTALGKSQEAGLAISRVAERIRERYKTFGEYSIGYLDEHRTLKRLLVDWERSFLWEITTHSGGMKLRNLVASELKVSLSRASELLDRFGPGKIPKSDMSLDRMRGVVESIKKEERFHA